MGPVLSLPAVHGEAEFDGANTAQPLYASLCGYEALVGGGKPARADHKMRAICRTVAAAAARASCDRCLAGP